MRLLEALLSAVLVAGLYATMAYGLALIYGVMKIINLANAGVMTLGAFVTWSIWQQTGLDPLLSVVIVFPAFFVLGMIIERTLVQRVSDSPPIVSLLLLFGLWLIMIAAASIVFGGIDRGVRVSYIDAVLRIGDIPLAVNRIIVFFAGVGTLVGLELFLRKTFLGRAIRALAQEREACALVGIDTRRVSMIAFGLGTAIAASAGSLLTVIFSINPTSPFTNFQLKSFTIIVLGGLESIGGVALASFLLAAAERFTTTVSKPQLENLVSFVLLVVVLVVMPGGVASLIRRRRLS